MERDEPMASASRYSHRGDTTDTLKVPEYLRQGSVIIGTIGDNMMRTQLSLEAGDYKLVKKEAKARGISIAEFVRRAVREQLPTTAAPPWMRYAGFVETGDPHSSQSIDEIVYGS